MNQKQGLIVLISFLVLYAYYTSYNLNNLKLLNINMNQNLVAANDTIEVLETKNGKNLSSISAKMYTINELKKQHDSLYTMIDSLDISPESITVIKIKYKRDTIRIKSIDTIFIKNKKATLNFIYDSSKVYFKSKVSIDIDSNIITNSKMEVTDLSVDLGLKTGIYSDKGIKKFYVTSDNESVVIDTLYGNIVPTYKKKSNYGLGIGIGPSISYDAFKKDVSVGIGINAGLVYKF
jgi:hypothetical protein